MIAYQDRIVVAAERCHLYNYDRAFRLKLSHNPSLRWDSLDQELWALWCTAHAKPFCTKCTKYGHTAAACSPGNRSSFRANNRTEDVRTICLQFNHSACPNASKCKYAHVCLKCEGEHPSSSGTCSGHITTRIHPLTRLTLSQNYAPTLTKHGVHAYSTPSDTVPASATTAPVRHESPKT